MQTTAALHLRSMNVKVSGKMNSSPPVTLLFYSIAHFCDILIRILCLVRADVIDIEHRSGAFIQSSYADALVVICGSISFDIFCLSF